MWYAYSKNLQLFVVEKLKDEAVENRQERASPPTRKVGKTLPKLVEGPEDPKLLERINDVKKLKIHPVEKADIILVLLGLKPAADIIVRKIHDLPETILAVLRKAGLVCDTRDHPPHPIHGRDETILCDVILAKDEDIFKRLEKVNGRLDTPKENQAEYASLMGYPRTAIQAFLSSLGPDRDPNATISHRSLRPDSSLFGFVLSREHAEEEVKTIDEWNAAISKYAPELMEQARKQEEEEGTQIKARYQALVGRTKTSREPLRKTA